MNDSKAPTDNNSEEVLSRFLPKRATISPALAETARHRLGVIALTFLAVTVAGFTLSKIVEPPEQLLGASVRWTLGSFGVVCDLVIIALVWSKSVPDRTVLKFGYVYQVARAAALSLAPLPDQQDINLTWALIATVFFPALLPPAGARSTIATVLSASTQPLALLLVHFFRMNLHISQLTHSVFSAAAAATLGLVTTDLVRRYYNEAPADIGSYDLVDKLGAGGMGEVWRARHRFLSRPAAVKLIPRDESNPRSAAKKLRRFRREAQVTANLTSPHTVSVFDYGMTESGIYYYVMEHLEGLDLQHLVRREGHIERARAIHLLVQSCDSIGEAHEAGLIHRDLKPSNLFVVRRGLRSDYLKVLDFGLVGLQGPLHSKTVNTDITAHGMMTGTPAYMSPEMVKGDELDGRADIYAIGCVFFFLITGRLVFPGLRGVQMALAHAHEIPDSPGVIAPDNCPADVEALIMMCLAKDPASRPRDMKELRTLLMDLEDYGKWTEQDAGQWWDSFRQDRTQDRMKQAVRRGEDALSQVAPRASK